MKRVVGMRYELNEDQVEWFSNRGCQILDNEDETKRIIFPASGKIIRTTPEPGRFGAFRFDDGTYVMWVRTEECCQMLCAGGIDMWDEDKLLDKMGDDEPKDLTDEDEIQNGWARELMMFRLMDMYQLESAEHVVAESLPRDNN